MNIGRWFLLALLSLPLLEIYVLIRLVGALGFLPTLALLLGAAAFGLFLLRTQGFSTFMRLQQALARGESPALEVLESGLVAAGGLLLLIPGFLSDLLALAFLIPATRRRLARHLLQGHIVMRPPATESGSITVEGEFEREDEGR